jgi:hypothetical protein
LRGDDLKGGWGGGSPRGTTPWCGPRRVVARRARRGAVVLAWILVGLTWGSLASPQDLTPRVYWPSPEGTKVAVFGYSHVEGDVLFDPSIPLYGVDSNIRTGILAYLQTFSLAGRTANVVVELPHSWGTTKGLLDDTPARRDFSGFNDLGLTLSVNLLGAPTMTPPEFQALRADPPLILGASLKILAPTGRYDSDRLINVGANRWATKLELGSVIPLRPNWLLELSAGSWFFTDDDDFLVGTREQDPIYAFQAHLVRRFKPGLWVSLNANYFTGGRQTIGGNELVDKQQNSRVGATVALPFRGRHAVKFGYFIGVRTEYGSDFDQFLLSYQVLLNKGPKKPRTP